ncbi:MAG TPA: DNA polymerase/3'-5' exonuclease PolX [Longimicrobiales bacterium]
MSAAAGLKRRGATGIFRSMENVEIASALSEVADLLDIEGDNPFRVRAYRTAVRTISSLTRPLAEMVAAGEDLAELPGIGHDIAGHITELVTTGHLKRLDDLERKVPASLAELMRIEGLGPRRARLLYEQLGIRSIAQLERAIREGSVAELKGFGGKTVAKLLAGVRALRSRPARFKLSDADQYVRPLLAYMRSAPGVERVEAAGSYRRRAETVGDIDLLVICAQPAAVMRHFTEYAEVARVEAAGRTRGTVFLKAGLQVDLRIMPATCYGAALHYFTGSRPHNIAVRALGVKHGLRISEYGVFRRGRAGGRPRRIGGAEEADVFDAVGMDPVPPELRENRGEIEAALEHRLPTLLELGDIRGDLQMHSTWSDGQESIETMAFAAVERGYEYICITDHSHAARIAGGLDPDQLAAQAQEITAVRRRLHGRLHLFHGMEVDILRDGTLDLADEHLDTLDLVIVSVHSHLNLARSAMTDRIIRALHHPAADVLGHPTGRIINGRAPCAIDLEAVLRAAAELDVAVEINAQPDRLDLDDLWARRARDLGVLLVVNTDAHSAASLGFMRYGVDQARRGWIRSQDVLNTRSLDDLTAWLGRRASTARPRGGARPGRRLEAARS